MPFPLISEISNSIKNGKDSFDSFTDLDITLSTGESQITEEIQVLHEQNTDPEEMRKFKCEKIGFYRHPTDCSKFYHCAEYRATTAQPESQHAVFVYKCPRGLVYDEHQSSCNWPSYSEPCQGSAELMPVTPKKFKCTTPGFHVHPVDCRWFYYCSDLGDGQLAAFEFLCPSHLLGFDEKNLLCNWKWMVPQCESNEQEKVTTVTEQSHNAREGHLGIGTADKIPNEVNVNKVITETILPISIANPIAEVKHIPLDARIPSPKQETSFRRDQLSVSKTGPTYDTSYETKSLERKTASFVNYTDAVPPSSPEKSNLKSENKPSVSISNTRNNTEKKYGTAYWHRYMITNPSRVQIPPYVFDVIIEKPVDFKVVNNEKSNSGTPSENNSSGEHRYGIGRVRKLNVRPVRNQSVNGQSYDLSLKKDEPYIFNQGITPAKENKQFAGNENTGRNYQFDSQSYYAQNLQGRAIGKNSLTNYKFEDTINNHQNPKINDPFKDVKNQQQNLANNFTNEENNPKNPQSTNSFARVKCSKLTAAATESDPTIIDENTFGCTGEVSLFVKMKEGNEFSKYVLKTDDISNSAHQESKQYKLLVNDTDVKNDYKVRNLQLKNTNEPLSKIQNNSNEKDKPRSSRYTQGRSASSNLNFTLSARSAPLILEEIRLDDQEKDSKDNLSLTNSKPERQNSEKKNSLEVNDFHYSLRHEREKEKETLTINTKAKFMPLSFYPQGVLLNVDLNHINEIPPQILLEVDIMLKNFMTNGNIDVNLLMKKLNATMEPMENVEPSNNTTNDKIDSMLNMLENILNSTDSKNLGTESNKDISDATFTSDKSVNSTTEELPYENITRSIDTFDNNTNISVSTIDENETNSSVSPTEKKNEKNIQVEEVDSPIHENKPFVRRRLFRKYRYPSIREQLEIQKLLASYRTTTQTPQPSTSTKNPKIISNRSRYPSIREQLLWNNNVAFGDSRNSLTSEKEYPSTPAIEFDDEKGYSSYSRNDEFGKKIKPAERDNSYQINNRWLSSSYNNELVNKNLAANISRNSGSLHSSQDTAFHTHFSNINNFVPYSAPENVKNTHFPQNYDPPQNPPSDISQFRYTLPLSPLPYPKQNPSIPSQGLPEVNYFNDYNKPLQYSTEYPSIVPQDISTGGGYSFDYHSRGSVHYTPGKPPTVPQDIPSSYEHSFNSQNRGSVHYNPENPSVVQQDLSTGTGHSFNHHNHGSVRQSSENPPDITSSDERSFNSQNRGSARYTPENPPAVQQGTPSSKVHPFNHDNHGPVRNSPKNPAVVSQDIPSSDEHSFNSQNRGYVRYTPENSRVVPHDIPSRDVHSFNQHYRGTIRYTPENTSIPQKTNDQGNPSIVHHNNLHHNRGSVRYLSESPSTPYSITHNRENSDGLHNRNASHYIPERDPTFSQGIPFGEEYSSKHHNRGSDHFSPENPSIIPLSETNSFNEANPGTSYFAGENPAILSHDVPVSAINSFNQHHGTSSLDGNSDAQNRNLSNRTQKRRRKSKKLRILVKKVPNGAENNKDSASRQDEQGNKRTRIPKKLLTEIRTNLIRKLAVNGKNDVELEIQFQDHVWNIPFVNNQSSVDISPVACTRAGLFQHPKDCNMFYECFWDKWLKRFTLHVFSCPVRLVYDDSIRGCSRPTTESHCRKAT
ncbi:uncharacterized protein LOC129969032 [Argiope bruennichi]|uniref:uncharacterized protein LOC129969032 n=1 Tax=Argiope bruennichi TaxID=94029 RepID=UPI0024958D2B|nr:uncharacterized protein LOC129969032 [Argiope bruennichi]